MNKLLKVTLTLAFSTPFLIGCGKGPFKNPLGNMFRTSVLIKEKGVANFKHDMKGEHLMPPGIGFGFPPDLNLTADQKKQFEQIMQENRPPMPDLTKIEEVRKAIKEAFLADTFDTNALKSKLDSLKPDEDARFKAEANIIIKGYNLLTSEQKQKLEAKQQEISKNSPFEKLVTDLKLSDSQKNSLKEAMKPSDIKPDFAKDEEKRKASREAINAELKTGNASVDKIKEILKSSAPINDMATKQNEGLSRLAKIHDILNAEQRKTFIEKTPDAGFGPGLPPGPPVMKHPPGPRHGKGHPFGPPKRH